MKNGTEKNINRPAFNRDIAAAIGRHYEAVRTKRPVAYTLMSSNPLIEVAYAAGIQPAFPENYACVCAAKHASTDYCSRAEIRKYSRDLCSYCRNNIGYTLEGGDNPPAGGIGDPDIFLITSSACTHYFKWWDTLHEIHGKPLVFVNTPRVMEREVIPDYYMDYAGDEILAAVDEIERHLGITISRERLSRAVGYSDQLVEYWQKILALQKQVPAPLNLSDLGNALFVLIVLAGTREGVTLMAQIYEETARRAAEGTGVLPAEMERHRLMWLNIPFWYNLKLFGMFENEGCVFPLSDYCQYIWGTTRMDPDRPVESLARKALEGELNTSVDAHIDPMLEDIEAYHIDGVVAHFNKSCRVLSVGALDAVAAIREKLNLPVLVLDGDHADESEYEPARTMTRVEAFLEMLG
ncbi:MAG: 2-hydroxyacyl-CoA dehydratase family protein [Deltaproteobacteria bacterium]|nr:2-hydroxyacyl-CoA dehydratase family protein [Deltaproteobacteria bacterium]